MQKSERSALTYELGTVKQMVRCLLLTLVLQIHFSIVHAQSERSLDWSVLPALPDKLGVAGPFVGTHNGVLLVAGGANFPKKMPWDGGTKVWHDTVYVLDNPDAFWKVGGKLPRPLGYGVSLSTDKGIVCLGGSDSTHHYADSFLLQRDNGELKTVSLPSLPKPCANFCGAASRNTIYVAGGIETPAAIIAMKTFWAMNLNESKPEWQELETWPGPARMLAVACFQDDSFYLASGVELSGDKDGKPVRKYLQDAYRYRSGQGWTRVADLPRAAVAAPTPAMSTDQSRFLIVGGDDGSLVNFKPPEAHPGFPRSTLVYNTISDIWMTTTEAPAGHVTTTMVEWNGSFVIPSGEIRPGVRSPRVWKAKVQR